MTEPVKIGWIRHGVTEWNQQGKIQGVTDIPLSPEGIAQAKLLAERLFAEGGQWQGIISSDLQRAEQTAAIIADRLELPLVTDARLRERSFGQAEGTTEPERLARWGADWRRHVPDQEQDDEVIARGQQFLTWLEERYAGQSWLVVTHGSFLARMLYAMCGPIPDAHLQNMSLTVLERRERLWTPLLHNCTAHLQ